MIRFRSAPFLILIIFLLTACSEARSEPPFLAEEGKIDLSSWDDEEATIVPLNGQWDFYWKQLLTPSDFKSQTNATQTGTIFLPNNWHHYKVDGKSLEKDGFATFRLKVTVKEPLEVLGLQLPVMYSNYTIWIDDELFAQSGKVGTNKKTSVAHKDTQIVYFKPNNTSFTLTLQISNFDNYAGGMLDPIKLGKSEVVQSSNYKTVITQAFILGVLILSGIYHIGLGFFRKSETYFFYFGFFCLITAFRSLTVGEVFLTKAFPNIDWAIAMKLEYISLYLHVSILTMFLYRLYPKEYAKWFAMFANSISIIYTVLTIFTDAKTYYSMLIYFQLFIICTCIYALYVYIKVYTKKYEGAIYALTGFLLLLIGILFDTFGFILKLPDYKFYPIGLVLCVLCFSLFLSKRLSTSLDLSEQLATDLSELNNELEQKVMLRTNQIQQSNQQLKDLNDQLNKMVLIDGLTRISNRRHFDEYIQSQYELCMREHRFLSILFIDIDYFKLFNDHYGHQKGDECLKEIAMTLNKHIPESKGLVARYGGEEFVCVLPNHTKQCAEDIAKELNNLVEQLRIPHQPSPVSSHVTISIGISTSLPTSETRLKELIQQADHALYQAKHTGRNKYVSFGA